MKHELIPTSSKITPKASHMDALVRMIAPEQKTARKRPSLNLGVALDQSGSMSANNAFEQAKQATLSLLSQLDATDRISVVLYNTTARVLLPSCLVSEARIRLPGLLACERAGGSTALHAGWLTAAQQIAPHVNEYGISRVLLLSDGQATDGQCNPAALKEEAYQLLAAGISTGTYGLGMNFNEVLMTDMAAGGPARFAEDADQLAPYFRADFDLLSQTVAPVVSLSIAAKTQDGVVLPVELLNGYSKDAQGAWRLPAAVAGAETWAAVRLDLADLGAAKLVEIEACWKWQDNQGHSHAHTETHEISVGKGKKNAVAIERCAEALAAKMAKEAAQAARMGDFASAQASVNMMRSLSASNAYIQQVSDNLDHLVMRGDATAFSKEALYSSTTMSNRVAESNENAGVLSNDRFGLRKAVQGKHIAQVDNDNQEKNP